MQGKGTTQAGDVKMNSCEGQPVGLCDPQAPGQPLCKSPVGTAVGGNALGKAREEKTWERRKQQQNQSNPKGRTPK